MPYIGNQPGTGVRSRFIYTATASQTTFSGADDNSKTLKYADSDYIDVFLNGVCLVPGTDYTASTKTSVVLVQAASVSDTLEVVAYDIASIADTVSKADGGTFNGDLGITNASPDITLTNNTTEDTDGGRESTVTFKGLQSGGEESTLAEIRASHDATADDQKGDLIFKTNDGSDGASPTEAMRIQSDQTILAGSPTTDDDQTFQVIKTGASSTVGIHSNRAAAGGSALILSHNRNTSVGSFTKLNDNDTLGRITFQGCDGVDIKTEGAQIHAEINGTTSANDLPTELVFSTTADGANSITERMRISNAGQTTLTAASDHPLVLNRTGNTGVFAEFKEGGTSRGAIDGNGTRLLIRSIGSASGLRMDGGNITPFYGGGESDNGIDLGYSAGRFKTVFAGTGSINTSDENEKQDIAALTDAEITAAKAISKLFKTYKWKDAVSSKGDAARTHAGVIAQQVQTAMSDAGLDSSKYGFWCSDTWWEVTEEIAAKEAVFHEDGTLSYPEEPAFTQKETYTKEEDAPEGATKRTRMGIRYAELLAFVGAATEQRLTSIEARLTALEAG